MILFPLLRPEGEIGIAEVCVNLTDEPVRVFRRAAVSARQAQAGGDLDHHGDLDHRRGRRRDGAGDRAGHQQRLSSKLQTTLLSATAHVSILEKNPGNGIEHWERLVPELRKLPHVISATPGLYGQVALKGPILGSGAAILKGIPVTNGTPVPPFLMHLRQGSIKGLDPDAGVRGIILGSTLAEQTGLMIGSPATVISYQGELTPFGTVPSAFRFKVAGIFESGMDPIDSAWAFVNLPAAQRVLDLNDVVNTIELRLDDIFQAPQVATAADKIIGPKLTASTWMEQNRPLLNAFRMEKIVSIITVGLIQLVAASTFWLSLSCWSWRSTAILPSSCRWERVGNRSSESSCCKV